MVIPYLKTDFLDSELFEFFKNITICIILVVKLPMHAAYGA